MATTQEIADCLQTLLLAFTAGQRGDKADTVNLYAGHLEEIPGHILRDAVDHLVSTRTSPFFPSVGEIKEAARHKMGHDWFDAEAEEKPIPYNVVMDEEYLELVRIYCQTPRQFDEARWLKLVRQLERMGREFKAGEVRKRMDAFKWTVENEHTPMYAEEYEKQRKKYIITDEMREEYA
jgi:hypothetical protein